MKEKDDDNDGDDDDDNCYTHIFTKLELNDPYSITYPNLNRMKQYKS